jgi:hypothetical protein
VTEIVVLQGVMCNWGMGFEVGSCFLSIELSLLGIMLGQYHGYVLLPTRCVSQAQRIIRDPVVRTIHIIGSADRRTRQSEENGSGQLHDLMWRLVAHH